MKTAIALILAPAAIGATVAGLGLRFWGQPTRRPSPAPSTPSWRHPIYHSDDKLPPQTPQEIERDRRVWNGLRAARRLSESGNAPEALRTLREAWRDMSPAQRDGAILNDRAQYDVLLRNGEYGTILAAYRARGGEPHLGVNAAVTIADIESDGRIDLPPEVGSASVSHSLIDMGDDVPNDSTVRGRLALAYLSVGQDYNSEAYFKSAQWYFERAVRLLPGDPFCAWRLGRSLSEQGQQAAALAVLAKARTPRTSGLRRQIAEEVGIARRLLAAQTPAHPANRHTPLVIATRP